MKWHSTDARIILAYLRETWLRRQHRSTFTKLIRRVSPNHVDDRGGHDDGDEQAARRCVHGSHVQSRVGESESAFDAGIERLGTPRAGGGQKFANSVFVL
jgi:hypothetical protein